MIQRELYYCNSKNMMLRDKTLLIIITYYYFLEISKCFDTFRFIYIDILVLRIIFGVIRFIFKFSISFKNEVKHSP